MKKVIFLVVFLIYTIFPVHIVYEEEISNTIALNSLVKTNYSANKYKLILNEKDNEISVCKDDKILRKLNFEGKIENTINLQIESKGMIISNLDINNNPKYYIGIFPNYIISSVPIDEKGTIIEDGKNIITTEEDIKWIYDTVPVGTEINEK
jgi:ABC-type maltose transport system permease subunit